MKNFVLRPHKFAKILSNILIGISIVLIIIFWLMEIYGGFWISFILLLLGLLLNFAYRKEYISFGENDILISKAFRNPQTCSYAQIRTFLIVPMTNQTQFVLVGKSGERLAALDSAFAELEKGVAILAKHGTQIIDIAELIEANQPIDAYYPALTKIQKNNVQHMLEMQKAAEEVKRDSASFNINKTKKRLRMLGIALCLAIVIGFFIGGKVLFGTCIAVLLLVYGLYVKYYPYMYFESIRTKAQDYTLQMPFLAPIISLLILIMPQRYFSFGLLPYITFVLIAAFILYLPFLLKVKFHAIQTRTARMISVLLATIAIAYTASFPLNVLLTFDTPVHTNVTVTDKDEIKSNKHDSWYIYVDDGTQFSVTKDEYQKIQKGDSMRICTRKSVFGFEYSTLHE